MASPGDLESTIWTDKPNEKLTPNCERNVMESLLINSAKRQIDESLLLHLVRLSRSGRGARTCGPLHGQHRTPAGNLFQLWHHKPQRALICRFFLHPHDFLCVRVALQFHRKFRFRERIHLLEKNDCDRCVFPLLAFGPDLAPDLAGANYNALRILDLRLRKHRKEVFALKILDWRTRLRMAQHTFRCKYNER